MSCLSLKVAPRCSAPRCQERQERSRRRSHVRSMRRLRRQPFEYAGLLIAALALALVASGTQLDRQIDKDAYDWIFRVYHPPDWTPQSIILAIDEESFRKFGGVARLRNMVAKGLERIAAVSPKAVAIDVMLADEGIAADNDRLEAAIRKTQNVVLGSILISGKWEEPLPRFSRAAAGV